MVTHGTPGMRSREILRKETGGKSGGPPGECGPPRRVDRETPGGPRVRRRRARRPSEADYDSVVSLRARRSVSLVALPTRSRR